MTRNSTSQYIHICSVDYAGNISNTRVFEIPQGVIIKFNKNDTTKNLSGDDCTVVATGTMPQQVITFGSTTELNENAYVKNGYTFVEWNTKSDGTGVVFTDKQEVSYQDLVDTYGFNLDIYAQWKQNEYDIYYEKGLTSDTTNTSITGATVNTNIQLTGINRPKTHCKFDSQVTFATIAPVKGRAYTLKFNGNRPSSVVKQKQNNSAVPTTTADIVGTLPSLNQWQITGQETSVTTNLKPQMNSTVNNPNYISTDKASVTATALWNNHTIDTFTSPTLTGWTFMGWYDNQVGNNSVNETTESTTTHARQLASKKVLSETIYPHTTAFEKTLYARWQRTVHLTFNLNGGQYQGSTSDVVLTGVYYNNADGYNFSLTVTPTAESLPNYDKQQNYIDAYGVPDINGENSKYIKYDSLTETTYRFLGWSLSPDATEPDSDLISFVSSHKTTYRIYDDTTLYAVWEPVLIANVTLKRSLGDLVFSDGSYPNGEAKNVRASSGTQNVEVIAKPGEQCYYTIITKGKNGLTAGVAFDTKITDIYDNDGIWKDNLNPPEPSYVYDTILNANCGLNRIIIVDSNNVTRKFHVPQYLGTEQSYVTSKGVNQYTVLFEIAQNSYFYQTVYGTAEQAEVQGTIYITTNKGPTPTPPGPGPGPSVLSVLDELRAKLKIRLH